MAFRKCDVSCKDATAAASAELSHVGPITRSKFKASGLDGTEYFASLEVAKKSRSRTTSATAIFGGNTPFLLFDKFSQTTSNLGEFEDLVDSPVSTKVNALMTDTTNMDEKFAMMEQTIEVLKKSVEDKDLQIAQLMNKLEAYAPGESSHVPPRSPVFTSQKTAEFKKNVASKHQTKESMAVKATSVKVTTKKKVKEDKTPSQYPKEEKRRPTLKELEAKVYPFPDSDVPTILDELLDKKVIDLPESKRPEETGKVGDPKYCKFHRIISHPTEKCFVLKEKIMALVSEGKIIIDMDETAKANHASIALKEKKCSKLHNMSSTASLQFGSFEPVEVDLPRKNLEGSLELDNHPKDKDGEGWILVTHKKRKHQAILRIRIPNSRAMMSNTDWLQSPSNIKSSTRKKINIALSPKFRKPITLHEFFPGKFLHGEKPSSDDEDDAKLEGENKAQWTTTKVPKKGSEEVSIKISSSKGDIQTKTEEHLVFRYVQRERRKKGQPLLQECTPKKQVSHKDIQYLKEHMTVPVAQIPSVTGESAKGNFQADKIKGHYDPKAFILLEKSGYDFSNPSQLGEFKDEVTGEKIHGLNESQMKLRKQGHYVATPKFGLGFRLAEPLRISSKRSKEIASSQYSSVEEMKEVKGKKIKQRASVFDRIGGSTPPVSVFERLSHKGERVSPKHLKEVSTTSKTSIFRRLGTTGKSPSRKILSKHKEQVHEERDHFEVVADKEICSAFPSHMKRKSILSISTDGPLKVQRRTIVYTCQPRKEAKKEKEAMPTIQGSQREKSDFVETSYQNSCEPKVEKPSSDDKADVKSEEENEAQWTTTKPPKKGTEEVSIKLSSSEGDIQTKTEEHLVFRYVPRERRKKGQPLLQECTLKKQMSHKDIQHLKEHMTVPVAQIPSVTCESAKGNPQADKIKGHYDPKAFILLEKSGYDFSNPSQLGELKDEVTGEKIHGLNESQMKLRKQGHYVATPKFGLGFSLAEPLRISSNRSKEIASSQYTSVEEMKEVKGNKIKQRASVFDRIGGSTPSNSVFERLSHKGGRVSSKHLKEVSTTSKTSVFCRLGTTRKLPSRKILSKHKEKVHEERDHFEVVADKEICSAFLSRMKRKSILSISTDGPLKVQRRTIVYTCQPRKEAKKEREAMPTIKGSQREKLDFVETS
ncbi:hypothetical protein A4A49_55051, partial [Nicotiana attenuata]